MKRLSPRVWLTLVLVGLVGQFAWTIENMYFNVYLYNTISTDPGYISAMVGWSAAAATLTTLLMGALSDRVGKRKLFICGGYLLWGLSTAAFGLVTVENAAKLFPPLLVILVIPGISRRDSTSCSIFGIIFPFKIRQTITSPVVKPLRISTWRRSPFPVFSS